MGSLFIFMGFINKKKPTEGGLSKKKYKNNNPR